MERLKLYLFHRNDRVRRIKPNSRIDDSYFRHRRWQLVTLLEQLSGYWPYQSKLKQYPLQLFHAFFMLTAFSALANKLREYGGVDNNMTIECCLFMLFIFGLFVKLFLVSTQQSRRRKIYKRITGHFKTMNDPEEAAVLNESAESGFAYTLVYISVMCLLVLIFSGVPIVQTFYRYFYKHCQLNVQLPLPMDFGFDHSKYWYIIAIDFITWICSTTVNDSAYDLSFILQVRHVSALFKIVGIRLGRASEIADEFENENENMSEDAANQSYSLVSSAIDLHVKCLELVKQIEECYTINWLIILLLSTGGFGAGLYSLSTTLHDPIETFRHSAVFIMVALHFHVIFSQGQIIIDSSSIVSVSCYECKWYRFPKKSRKLLLMMMMRSSIPCQLTGGKLFPLSMISFNKMFKAGLSYYTLFRVK